jgi:formylglycine-generating enzyme required for sulfatase activity
MKFFLILSSTNHFLMLRHLSIVSLLLFYGFLGHAQRIENVVVTQQNKTIEVTYNLEGLEDGQTAGVSLHCSEDGGTTWSNALTETYGDVREGVNAGTGKRIIWHVLEERERLSGDRIVFEVRAVAKSAVDFGFEMVFVKGGTFTMGCTSMQDSDCYDNEKPTRRVTLSDYYIGKYEVTQKQWRAVMGASTSLSNPSYFKNCDDCPVERVSWNDIQQFIKKLNQLTGKKYRLPTEAEWEYAARGSNQSKGYKYAGSNTIDEVAWYDGNSGGKTQAVGRKKPNELGLYDMSGNVWEWCNDWYGNYTSNNETNPQGPSSGSYRVLRGGRWSNRSSYCRVSNRSYGHPDGRLRNNGFRLVQSL